jgi:hypothetical protein
MKAPPFLLFATLLFWGWQSELIFVGLGLGVVLESARVIKTRWDVADQDFRRIWTFCVLLALALALYVFTTNQEGGGFGGAAPGATTAHNTTVSTVQHSATTFFRWLPITLFLFIAAQFFSERELVPLSALSSTSLVIRWRRLHGGDGMVERYVDASYPYFIVCLFSAGIHPNNGSHTYFWGQCALITWALWTLRSRRFGLVAWAGALVAVMALGFLGQLGINQTARLIQNFNAQWMSRLFRQRTDAAQSLTSMGRIGEMKLSPRIVIRLEPEKIGHAPTYLREASYRNYDAPKQAWRAGRSRNEFTSVFSEHDTTYTLVSDKTNAAAVNIACYLDGWSQEYSAPEGLLPLPSGSGRLENLQLVALQLNKTGAALATGSGLVIFDARYGPGATADSPPALTGNAITNDLFVPTNELPALERVAAEINFSGTNETQRLQSVEKFFFDKFSYSVWQGPDKLATANATPLTRFLLTSRSGHCEYFASATVLLLRRLGLPARYAVGFYVHETAGSGYVVRERDAHAWCLVWNGKTWDDFDTTPPSWVAVEGKRASWLDWFSDGRSWLGFQFAKFRWGQAHLRQYILWALVPALAVLLYHIIFRKRKKRAEPKRTGPAAAERIWPGLDSEFYRLEKKLAARGLFREPGEPCAAWLERVLAEPSLAALREPLRELLRLHYRHRFDPEGLNAADRQALAEQAQACLQTLAQK